MGSPVPVRPETVTASASAACSSGFRGRHAPRCGPHRSGAGFDLDDDAGGHRIPDDVVAAVVLAGDAVQRLDVDGVARGRAAPVRRRRQRIGAWLSPPGDVSR